MKSLKPFTLFYDGACPLCLAEITYLKSRNQAGLLSFVDINSASYDPQKVGVSCKEALAKMYGQVEGETPINGVAVFAEAYRRVNLKILDDALTKAELLVFCKVSAWHLFFAGAMSSESGAQTLSSNQGLELCCLIWLGCKDLVNKKASSN
jgi:DCC1-like thiol-disulfide oxidoreductase